MNGRKRREERESHEMNEKRKKKLYKNLSIKVWRVSDEEKRRAFI